MAELESSCCTTSAQASCCDVSEKASYCGERHAERCGCAASSASVSTGAATAVAERVRETVREKYAAAAKAAAEGESGVSDAAVGASLGCGVPTAVADLHEGETVLDLGSGAGADVVISARRVGPTGRAIGIDMTDEMLGLARRNAAAAGVDNVIPQGLSRGAPAPGCERRRGDLQLRD